MAAPNSLTLCHIDAERKFSGGEVQVFLLMHGLRERGHRSVLMAPPGSEAALRAARDGFEVREVPMRSDLDLPGILAATRILREVAPDLVHLHTGRAAWLGGLAARRANLPAIVTRRMDRDVRRGWRTRMIYGSLTCKVAAISESVAAALEAGGVPKDRIALIRSSIDPDAFAPRVSRRELRAELGVAEDSIVVLTLGALVQRKGLDVLFTALEQLSTAGHVPDVWIAGEGAEQQALQSLARAKRLARVRFLGRRSDVAELLGAADLFAMPSRREGLGVAALEAMAAGCPVVASGVGGLAEVVESEVSGLLVAPEDPAALAEALGRLITDPALRARMSEAGRVRVAARHSARAMVEAYEALYRRVLAELDAASSR